MPTYQYRCNRCDNEFKRVQSQPMKVCPKCGSWLFNYIVKEKKKGKKK